MDKFKILLWVSRGQGGDMDLDLLVEPDVASKDVAKALSLALREEVKRIRPGIDAIGIVRRVADVFRVLCDKEKGAQPCVGKCGGIAQIVVEKRGYCTGCLAGGYILAKFALDRTREELQELRSRKE